LEKVGIRKFFNGPESFTPDTNYLLGETLKLKTFLFVVVLIVLELLAPVELEKSLLNG